jgi:hypothetical protein
LLHLMQCKHEAMFNIVRPRPIHAVQTWGCNIGGPRPILDVARGMYSVNTLVIIVTCKKSHVTVMKIASCYRESCNEKGWLQKMALWPWPYGLS